MHLKINGKSDVAPAFDGMLTVEPPGVPNWLALCATSKNGDPLNNLQNVLIAMRNDEALFSVVGLDEMQRTVVLTSPLPGAHANDFSPRAVGDHDVTHIQEYLQQSGLKQVSWDLVRRAVEKRATECPFHPVGLYFESLAWDGVPRVGTWLTKYLGAKPSPYNFGIGVMILVAMVARILKPGCKADYMPILEGPQGAFKSTACAVLGGNWYSDALPNVTGGKEEAQHLRGKWVIEIAEMSAMSKAESAHLKAFVTRRAERYRPPYGYKEVHEPRQCVFIGTTNQTLYLRDETGSRRFWPIQVGIIDLAALQKDRDQLFAEAIKLFKEGTPWHPDAEFERQHVQPEQDARFLPDAWEEHVQQHLNTTKPERVLVGQLLDVVGVGLASRGRAHQNRIVGILHRLGWRRLKKDSKGNIPWGPPVTDSTDDTDNDSGSSETFVIGTPAGQ